MPHPAELNQLVALFNVGQYAELERRSLLLLGRCPGSGIAWKILGVTLQAQHKDSLHALQKAAEFLPGDAEAHYNLGNTFLMQGRLNEAEASFRRALQIKPDDADQHYNLGNTLLAVGRLKEAEACYRRVLQIRPDHAEAYSNLGNALVGLGRLEDAKASYRQAILIKPHYAAAHFNLGNLFHEAGCLVEAESSYRRALQIKPDCADTYTNLGNILRDMERLDEAEASYRQALQIKPDHAEASNNLGEILLELGRLEEAEASFRRALRTRPDYLKVRMSLASAVKTKAGDDNMAALIAANEALRSGRISVSEEDAVCMHFALGKCYGDIGDHEKAFPHFLEGNRLKRSALSYDPDQIERNFAEIMRNFDSDALRRLSDGGDSSNMPIFILGMPRSGTTLTEQIIASHPDVYGAGEVGYLRAIVQQEVSGTTFPANIPLLDRDRLAEWGAEYVAKLQRRAPNALRITDKMPANFLAVGLIHLILPNAKIIHVNRNPVDTCLSCFTTLFRQGQEYTYDLAELGRYYAAYMQLMDHWRKVLPEGAFLDVRYEDIVADHEVQARRLIEYCGLKWHDDCVEFHKNARAVNTASMVQVRQPVYRSSVERWRSYEKFLAPLFDTLGGIVASR